MLLKYGNYSHAQNEARIDSISRSSNLGPSGVVVSITERWSVSGRMQADTQAALTTALAALESAYLADGLDLIFYLDDGTTETVHKMTTAAGYSGIRVVEPISYPDGGEAEYSTFRNYRFGVEGQYMNLSATILDFQETIEFSGGGPETVWVPILNGPPQPQTIRQQTVYQAIQSGSALGAFSHPVAPPPLFPDRELVHLRSFRKTSPKRLGAGQYTEYPIAWGYTFASDSPLNGGPTAWPI